jgi:hypothetical protein
MNISTEWTDKERLAVILVASVRASNHLRSLETYKALCVLESIEFVANKPATWLENNRKQIMEDCCGQKEGE